MRCVRHPHQLFARVILIGATVAFMFGAPPASGHYLWHEDPAGDTDTRFDLKGVRLFRKSEPSRGVVRVRTFEPIDLNEGPLLRVFFDSRGGIEADRAVAATFDGGSSGYICLGVLNVPRDEYIDGCELRHGNRLWQVTFRWKALDATRHVRWWVDANAVERDDPEFQDRAPDEGWFEH